MAAEEPSPDAAELAPAPPSDAAELALDPPSADYGAPLIQPPAPPAVLPALCDGSIDEGDPYLFTWGAVGTARHVLHECRPSHLR